MYKCTEMEDLNLVISGGYRRLLNVKVRELSSLLSEIVKMEQLTDITLSAGTRNNVFVFKYQSVNINIGG